MAALPMVVCKAGICARAGFILDGQDPMPAQGSLQTAKTQCELRKDK
ncbi:MAG: hypothetical protein Q4F00_06195 [bacterium]|nr:hypothetical protein [bacterium]